MDAGAGDEEAGTMDGCATESADSPAEHCAYGAATGAGAEDAGAGTNEADVGAQEAAASGAEGEVGQVLNQPLPC